MVAAPTQRNSREENAAVKAGGTPEDWSEAKRRQKDTDARWTKKHGKAHYGYKNHISVDRKHKVIRRFAVTSAATHDSQVFAELLDPNNSSGDVWADSAYRSAAREAALAKDNYRSHIHRKGTTGRPLKMNMMKPRRAACALNERQRKVSRLFS